MDFGSFNLGNVGSALKLTGSDYELPEGLGSMAGGAESASSGFSLPAKANDALAATGSDYRAPAPPTAVEQAHDDEVAGSGEAKGGSGFLGNAMGGIMGGLSGAPDQQSGDAGADDQKNAFSRIGKVAGLVASFYTGGASGVAMKAASGAASKNNPNAGAAMGIASSFL